MLGDAGADDVHRERAGVERLVDLLPAQRRRDRRALLRAHRVDRGDRLALAVLVRVDQDAWRFDFVHSVVTRPRWVAARAPATISENWRVSSYVCRRAIGTSTWIPSEPLVFGNDSSPSASSVSFTSRATCTVSRKPTSGDGSRSKSTKSGRSSLSTREYQVFRSMQPMFTIHSRASSSFTSGASIRRRFGGRSRVVTSMFTVGIQSGIPCGLSFWKNDLPKAPSG